ncbi:MAG: ABC transporter substrate-binding protein [Gammaproteobacteria bacterium]|nr:ABC transporter substrate-binding protein [Gammaproteobacteria bacterium]
MNKLITILILAIFGSNAWVGAEELTPEQIVEQTSTELLQIINEQSERIKNEEGYVNSVINELILPVIDLQSMGKLILGKHWKTASDEQRSQFIEQFKSMLIRTYAKSVADFGHAKVTVFPPKGEQKGKRHRVKSHLDIGSGTPLQVDYVFRRKDDSWKVFDLVVDGLSLIKNFRTSFSQEISETSLDALIKRLESTNAG